MQQSTLFELPPSVYQLEKELQETKQELSNVRKGLFKRWAQLEEEIHMLRASVCELRGVKAPTVGFEDWK